MTVTRRCQRVACPVRFRPSPEDPEQRYCCAECQSAEEGEIAVVARASRRPVARIHIRGFVVHTTELRASVEVRPCR